VVDAGTGSGILAIAAAKLGWGPVFAFDNDGIALTSARENVLENGVSGIVEVHETDIDGASLFWFSGATVLANMTLDPVLALLGKLAPLSRQARCSGGAASVRWPERIIVSGILAGAQEGKVVSVARLAGFKPGRTIYEAEWVSLEFLPERPTASSDPLRG
jgi:ribosomal protein L11 methyltransferase